MILTGNEIRREVHEGRIVVDPFDDSNINPNSYNYRLGLEIMELRGDRIYDLLDAPASGPLETIPEDGLVLRPGRLYLCSTAETLGSDYYVTSLIGKSSMGRLGLFLQISADLGHQGRIHRWTLELRCCQPIRVYPNMLIGQVSFWKTEGEPMSSRGYYARFDRPTPKRTD